MQYMCSISMSYTYVYTTYGSYICMYNIIYVYICVFAETGHNHFVYHKGVRQPLKKDDFSDLLNVQGFSKPDQTPRTLKDMKKGSDIEGAIDPERARVIIYTHNT